MKSKVQDEAGYEPACGFSDKEANFVDSGAVDGKMRKNLQPETKLEAEAEAAAAEKGKSRARLPAHENKDAAIMKARVSVRNDKHRG